MKILVNLTLRKSVQINQLVDWNHSALPLIGHEILDITTVLSADFVKELKTKDIKKVLPKKEDREDFSGNAYEYFSKKDSAYYSVDNIIWTTDSKTGKPVPELFISPMIKSRF